MRQRILRVISFLAVLGLVGPDTASAQYLDPGAGSILIQAVLAGIVGVATFTKIYWHKIRGFVSKSQE
jgi:hypothetical protein